MDRPEFTLRPWRETDLPSLVKYANDPTVAGNLMDTFPHPYTEDDGKAFLQRFMANDPQLVLAIEVDGEAAGAVGIHPQGDVYRRNAELGYWLAEPYWGQGIITRAIQQMVDYGFQNWAINRIFARPFGTNLGSQKALEKAGFLLEARLEQTIFKNGEYLDELIYAVRRK